MASDRKMTLRLVPSYICDVTFWEQTICNFAPLSANGDARVIQPKIRLFVVLDRHLGHGQIEYMVSI